MRRQFIQRTLSFVSVGSRSGQPCDPIRFRRARKRLIEFFISRGCVRYASAKTRNYYYTRVIRYLSTKSAIYRAVVKQNVRAFFFDSWLLFYFFNYINSVDFKFCLDTFLSWEMFLRSVYCSFSQRDDFLKHQESYTDFKDISETYSLCFV